MASSNFNPLRLTEQGHFYLALTSQQAVGIFSPYSLQIKRSRKETGTRAWAWAVNKVTT